VVSLTYFVSITAETKVFSRYSLRTLILKISILTVISADMQWRFLGCTTVCRDEKGKFKPNGPQDTNNNSTIREKVCVAEKRKRENLYAGVLLA